MQTTPTRPTPDSALLEWVSDNGIYLSTLLLFGLFTFGVPGFLSLENLLNILAAAAVKGIMAAGFSVALIAGLIDVSVIGMLAVASVLTGVLFQTLRLPLPLVLLLVALAAVLVAAFNTALTHNARIPSFVATTGSGGLLFGLAVALTGGQSIPITRSGLEEIFLARPLGVTMAIWLTLLVYALAYVMLNQTRLGAHFYALGISYNAARLNGVPIARVTFLAYLISALVTALAAVIATSRAGVTLLFGTTLPGFDVSEIFIIALLGGASLFGGFGKIERNLVAALFLATLANGLQILRAPTSFWLIAKGLAFVAAVIFDTLRQRQLKNR